MGKDKYLLITAQSIEIRGYELNEVSPLLKRLPATFNPPPVATQGALNKIERKLTAIWEVLEDIELDVLGMSDESEDEDEPAPSISRASVPCETNCCPACCGCENGVPKNDQCWCGLGEKVRGRE